MGKINSHELSRQVRTLNHRRLFQSLQNKDLAEVEELMRQVLSPSEIEMISKRIAVATLLEVGADYRQIQDLLKVSKATIAKVNNLYRYHENFRKEVRKFVAEEHQSRGRGYTLTRAAKELGLVFRILAQIR